MNTTDPMNEPQPMFDDAQSAMLLSALRIRPGGGATVEEVEQLFDWACRVAIDRVFLNLVLKGDAVVIGFEGEHPRLMARVHADATEAAAEAERLLDGGER